MKFKNLQEQCLFEELNKKAFELRNQGLYAEALNLYLEADDIHPNAPAVWAMVAECHWALGDLEAATEALRRALRRSPHSEFGSKALYGLLLERGMKSEAFEEMKRYLTISKSEYYDEEMRGYRKLLDPYCFEEELQVDRIINELRKGDDSRFEIFKKVVLRHLRLEDPNEDRGRGDE